MTARSCYGLEFANQKYQRHAHQDKPSQRGETIQKSQEGGLAFEKGECLRLRVNGRICV
jgi:hypothetical protein